MKRTSGIFRHAFVTVFLAPVRFYQRFISPALPRRCKYEPTCSAYAVAAVRELGVVRGTIVAAWRLLRCNPWSHGGWDPVSDRTLFRARHPRGQTRGQTPLREVEGSALGPSTPSSGTHKHEAHA